MQNILWCTGEETKKPVGLIVIPHGLAISHNVDTFPIQKSEGKKVKNTKLITKFK